MTTPDPTLWSDSPQAEPALLASRDRTGGERVFPPLPAHSPLAARYETVPIERGGRVYSHTVIHPAAKTGLAPYALGYVDFPGPVRIFGRIQGTDRPAIGARVVARPDADYGYVFEADAA